MSQKLRGFIGQSMNGQKKALTPTCKTYSPGSYTFTAPKAGIYRFVVRGPGGKGVGGFGGGGGALVVADRALGALQAATIVVGNGELNGVAADTTVTLPGGEVITGGAGSGGDAGGVGGSATSSGVQDTRINGASSAAGVTGGASGGNTDFPAAAGGNGFYCGKAPGGGGYGNDPMRTSGDGMVLVYQIKMGR